MKQHKKCYRWRLLQTFLGRANESGSARRSTFANFPTADWVGDHAVILVRTLNNWRRHRTSVKDWLIAMDHIPSPFLKPSSLKICYQTVRTSIKRTMHSPAEQKLLRDVCSGQTSVCRLDADLITCAMCELEALYSCLICLISVISMISLQKRFSSHHSRAPRLALGYLRFFPNLIPWIACGSSIFGDNGIA